MAPPPRYLITRKLVKRFFDSYLPKETSHSQAEANKLLECWEKFGVASSKCKEFEMLYDNVIEENIQYQKKVKAMGFKTAVLSTLKKPVYDYHVKGRYRKPLHFNPKTIFDGVQ